VYPVVGGTPMLLSERSRRHADQLDEQLERETVYPLPPTLRRIRKLLSSPGPFWAPNPNVVGDVLARFTNDPNAVVLHLGAKQASIGAHVIHIDLYRFPGVDLVTDAEEMGIASNVVDCVYLPALLEHVPHPARVIAEVRRVLRPGGTIIVEMPFMQSYHADPDDYQRYTISGLRVLLSEFNEVGSGALAGPSSTLALVLRDWLASWVPRHRFPRGHRAAKMMFEWSTFWIKYGDAFLISAPAAHEAASGLYYIGTRA
jgi:SAM-dependent methyltransferase